MLTTKPNTTAGSPKSSADVERVVLHEVVARDRYAVRSLSMQSRLADRFAGPGRGSTNDSDVGTCAESFCRNSWDRIVLHISPGRVQGSRGQCVWILKGFSLESKKLREEK